MKRDTNIHYQWGGNSIVAQLDVRTQKNGQSVAYLYASPDAPKEKLLELRAALRLKGWGTLSDHRDGKFVLRLSGIRNPQEPIALLADLACTQGARSIHTDAPEKEKPQGLVDSIRTNSLRASGIFYSMGNAVYLASGILRNRERGEKNYGQIQSALAWGAGDALVAAIGGKDDSRQMASLLTKLKTHYQREGIDIPATAAIHVETSDKNKTIGGRVYDFAHQYLNQIKCATEVYAAKGYYKAGAEQGNKWKQATAVIFGTGFFASLVIPEKKIDPEKYEEAGALSRLWMRIRANPLSVGGLSGYSNTILTSYGAFDEGRRLNDPLNHPAKINKLTGQAITPSKYYKLDYAAPAVMFFGNGLYAASKKTTGGDIRTTDMISDVYRIASQIINKLPETEREAAIESTAKFLGERPEVRDTHAQVRDTLRREMAIQRQNPWFENITLPVRTKPANAPTRAAEITTPQPKIQAEELTNLGKGVTAANDTQFLHTANGR